VYKPASKWTIVAACIVAVVLCAGAVVWAEMQQEKPAIGGGAPVPIHSLEG
jgi:anti-sigma-K factor RskA